MILSSFIADVWREYTSYDLDLEEEETTEIAARLINTPEMDVICAEAVDVFTKGVVFLFMVSLHVMFKSDSS